MIPALEQFLAFVAAAAASDPEFIKRVEAQVKAFVQQLEGVRPELGAPPPEDGEDRINAEIDRGQGR